MPSLARPRLAAGSNTSSRVIFRATSQLKTALKSYEGDFNNEENKGLDDDGFALKWFEDHPDDTIKMRDGTVKAPSDYGL